MRLSAFVIQLLIVSGLVMAGAGSAFTAGTEAPPASGFADPRSQSASTGTVTYEELLKLRDPFKVTLKTGHGTVVDKASPLESYAVDSFILVGIITGPARLRAVLRDPTGAAHTVSDGARIGRRSGWIKKIQEDRLIVAEKMTNILGQVEEIDTELPLIAEGGKGKAAAGAR